MPYKLEDILSVLSESSLDDLFNEYDFYSEGTIKEKISDTGKKVKDGASKVANSQTVKNISDKTNTAINKTSDVVTKKLTERKRPSADAPADVQEKFQKSVTNTRAAVKGGITMAAMTVLPKPLDIVLLASTIKDIKNSDDPSDKIIAEKLRTVADKTNGIKERLTKAINDFKNKKISEDQLRSQTDAVYLQGMNYAKEIDAVKARAQKEQPVTESTVMTYAFDKYLIKENGSLVDNAYELLSLIVEKVDYEKYDVCDIVEGYINMLM